MVKKIVLAAAAIVAVLVIGFAIVVAMQPSDFRIARSATVEAPAEEVFDQVNDLQNFQVWNPWAKLDPNAKYSYEGPSSGEGAVSRWSGNDQIGEGSMTITESRPHELVRIKLAFVRPMEDTADTDFTFEPEGNQTKVTWAMSGKHDFVGKAVCLFMDMDKMLGGEFEKGLADLKQIVEAPEQAEPAAGAEGTSAGDEPAATSEGPATP